MADYELPEWQELARSVTDEDRVRHTPPPFVWDNIQEAVAESESQAKPAAEPAITETSTDTQPVAPAMTGGLSETEPTPEVDEIIPPENVIDLSAERDRAPASVRKSRRHLILAAAASVLAVVAGLSLLNMNQTPAETLVATVTNETLEEPYDGSAVASLERDDDPMLEITFDGPLPTEEPVELWLIKPDLSDMRSLGIVEPGDTTWDWPADLDPAEYSLVDLSIEPNDGDPTHSGRSILRGELTDT